MTALGGWGMSSPTRKFAFDSEQIMPMRVFSVEALVYGEMLVLEAEDLLIVNVGEHYVSAISQWTTE